MSEGGSEVYLEAFTEFLNAVEAGIAAARQLIKTQTVGWDASKIKWETTEGNKGPYERSDDVNNPEYKAMLRDLVAHGGRMTHEGHFCWVFQNGSTVGRKRKRGKLEPKAEVDLIGSVRGKFPSHLEQLLTFEQDAGYVVMKPREYLGSENFSKIAAIVRGEGGEYVSAGRQSHFRVKSR